jgi:hypothetical protein
MNEAGSSQRTPAALHRVSIVAFRHGDLPRREDNAPSSVIAGSTAQRTLPQRLGRRRARRDHDEPKGMRRERR